MSSFGKNIKKIRGVKRLSQQAFAELFDLKRATLGAYEEGRSEPKIETIIKIANYFSIAIDDLLTSELTVNKLLQFRNDLAFETSLVDKEYLTSIPLITERNSQDYLKYFNKQNFINDLPKIQLPITNKAVLRGFTVMNLEMTSSDYGLYPNDVVIGELINSELLPELSMEDVVLVVTEKELILRHAFVENKEVVLRAAHKNIDDIRLNIEDVKELWKIKYSFLKRLPEFRNPIEDKLFLLEREFAKLKGKV